MKIASARFLKAMAAGVCFLNAICFAADGDQLVIRVLFFPQAVKENAKTVAAAQFKRVGVSWASFSESVQR